MRLMEADFSGLFKRGWYKRQIRNSICDASALKGGMGNGMTIRSCQNGDRSRVEQTKLALILPLCFGGELFDPVKRHLLRLDK